MNSQEIIQPAHVPGFSRLFDKKEQLPRERHQLAGRILLGELNCVSCHRAKEAMITASPILQRSAPVLDHIGSRVRPEWLHNFLSDPHVFKPGTAMPDMLAGMNDDQRQSTVEALVHFLASTGSVAEMMADRAAIERGQTQFHRLGCVACHGPHPLDPQLTAEAATVNDIRGDSESDDDEFRPYDPGPSSSAFFVPLGRPAKKYTVFSLKTFLLDPLAVRPSGRMPAFPLTEDEATDLAAYFFRDSEFTPNVTWKYYEGNWNVLPNFDDLNPAAEGVAVGFDLSSAPRKNQFGMRFSGYLHLVANGKYKFYLGSDDGSRLTINNQEIVNVDGTHPYQQKTQEQEFSEGIYPIVVDYFQGGGEWVVTAEYEGPGIPRQPLATAVTLTADEKPLTATHFHVDPELAARGRVLFGELGCAACHTLRENGSPIPFPSHDKIPALTALDPRAASGCLGDNPKPIVPRYPLNEPQLLSLRTTITALKKPSFDKPADNQLEAVLQDRIHQTLAIFNCYACHRRGELGGVTRDINEYFTTTTPEMGDEGRLPPTLTGIGDKLTTEWMKKIFNEGTNDRPYMHSRMPKFGLENVGHLVDVLPKLDLVTASKKPESLESPHRMKSNGRFLAGDKALSCIKCHRFGQHAGTGLSSIDLTTMTQRLREDWYYRYMLNPQDYRPGTRMPAPWPFGQATVRNVLEGNATQQMMAVWDYLQEGPQAPVPTGLIAEAIELIPESTPIVYRNFIEGVNPRAIAVGYPEKVHLTFDAENCNWALIWHGQFIDASRHWTGRGPGFQRPLGDHVVSFDSRSAFAELENKETAWPTSAPSEQKISFRGYRLDAKRRPIFRYRISSFAVEDYPEPLIDNTHPEPGWRRTVTVTADESIQKPTKLWFRVANGSSISLIDDGSYLVNDTLRIKIDSMTEPLVRTVDNHSELMIPVTLVDGKSTFVIDMIW
ncbi:MAG: PA14 domain-containing protein [Planctomycetota bacterium]|nr:PA14 domain-containing protein [Planctomycetota bacterium]MDA1213515.1 PA14 domain-containing protein [Planctomycetota bacterium]